MNARVLRAADYRRMRWKNGGGWTIELAVAASVDDTAVFDWRVSIAEIEGDGAFSTFPGCDRHIALLDGAGMELRFDAAPAIRLDQRLKFARFPGEWQTEGRLLGGPVRDFNVIFRRDAFAVEVLHRPLVGPMVFLPEAATTWFVHIVGGQAALKDISGMELSTGESLLLEPDDAARNRVLSGGGEVIVIKLKRLR
jgi:environmental stress-induced protein Ves